MTTGEHASTAEHLAEMDRLLRDIQVELEPGREPAPALETPREPDAAGRHIASPRHDGSPSATAGSAGTRFRRSA